MKYSYKKCKKFLKDNNFKVTRSDYIHIEGYDYGDDRIVDKLSRIVKVLNGEYKRGVYDFRSAVIYTLLKK